MNVGKKKRMQNAECTELTGENDEGMELLVDSSTLSIQFVRMISFYAYFMQWFSFPLTAIVDVVILLPHISTAHSALPFIVQCASTPLFIYCIN